MSPGAASHLRLPSDAAGTGGLRRLCSPAVGAARVPRSLQPVHGCCWGLHMLDGSLGFPVSTSGLKATEPLREGPAACLDAETGDCGVDAPATERLG